LQTRLFPTSDADRDLGTVQVKPQSFLHGHIDNAVRQPIQLLRLNGTVAMYNTTDETGDYRLRGLVPGRYRVQAGGIGSGWLRWRSDIVTLEANQHTEANGALDRGADIHGVLRSQGKPVPFTDILVRKLHGPLVAGVTTNKNGFYRVSGLTPATYRVGILYDGSDFQRHGVTVEVPERDSSVVRKIVVQKGAVITVSYRANGRATRVTDELRDPTGRPVQANRSDGSGKATYTGLRPGRYTVVGANDTHYAMSSVRVTTVKTYVVGPLSLESPTLTLSGTTAPRAVVEAKTGQECPPDSPLLIGAFQYIERADASGHYEMTGVVPGLYMLGSDGWPFNYVPRCVPDVTIDHSQTKNLPLQEGSTAAGRLVYASTGTPVITTLSYDIHYPPGQLTNPTSEHPTRDKTTGASGNFLIDRLAPGTVTGALALGGDSDQVTSPKFFVIYPFQDFTPYYLTSRTRTIEIGEQDHLKLGKIPLYLHEAPDGG
jgi:carboxypeptidase family protein